MILSPLLTKTPNRYITPLLLLPLLTSSLSILSVYSMATMASTSDAMVSKQLPTYPMINAQDAAALDAELMMKPEGFSIDQLMELAGLAVATAIYKVYPPTGTNTDTNAQTHNTTKTYKNILIIAGPGNNGGDALVAARHLALWGYKPTIIYPKQPIKDGKIIPLFGNLIKLCENLDISIYKTLPNLSQILGTERQTIFETIEKVSLSSLDTVSSDNTTISSTSITESIIVSESSSGIVNDNTNNKELRIEGYDLIIDGIFGFSFQGQVRPPFDTILSKLSMISEYTNNWSLLRSYGIPIISIDIPSGWSVDSGPPILSSCSSSSSSASAGILYPSLLISLTAPKPCSRYYYGPYHYLGGRFIPPKLAKKYNIHELPAYPGCEQVVQLT